MGPWADIVIILGRVHPRSRDALRVIVLRGANYVISVGRRIYYVHLKISSLNFVNQARLYADSHIVHIIWGVEPRRLLLFKFVLLASLGLSVLKGFLIFILR